MLGMGVTRNGTKGWSVTITQDSKAKSLFEWYDMVSYNPGYTPGVGTEFSPDQSGKKLLNQGGKHILQALTGSVIHLG